MHVRAPTRKQCGSAPTRKQCGSAAACRVPGCSWMANRRMRKLGGVYAATNTRDCACCSSLAGPARSVVVWDCASAETYLLHVHVWLDMCRISMPGNGTHPVPHRTGNRTDFPHLVWRRSGWHHLNHACNQWWAWLMITSGLSWIVSRTQSHWPFRPSPVSFTLGLVLRHFTVQVDS